MIVQRTVLLKVPKPQHPLTKPNAKPIVLNAMVDVVAAEAVVVAETAVAEAEVAVVDAERPLLEFHTKFGKISRKKPKPLF
jgi:hypothetical protein